MPDRERVIATLEYCLEHGAMGGHDCWLHCDANGKIKNSNARDKCPNKGCGTGCVVTPIREAIELLNAQEPVKPVILVQDAALSNGAKYICGKCGGSFFRQKVNYCPWCGKEVEWE